MATKKTIEKEKSRNLLSDILDIFKALPIAILYDISIIIWCTLMVPMGIIAAIMCIIKLLILMYFDKEINISFMYLFFYPAVKLEKLLFKNHEKFINIWMIFKLINPIILAVIVLFISSIKGEGFFATILYIILCAVVGYVSISVTTVAHKAYERIEDK